MRAPARLPRKAFAVLLAFLLIVGLFPLFRGESVYAGALSTRSDTLDSSAFSVASKHTIKFTVSTALTADNSAGTNDFSFKVSLPTNAGGDPFTLPSLAASDISATCASCASVTMTVGTPVLNNEGGAAANDSVLIPVDTGTSGATLPIGSIITLTIGTGSTKITNPADNAAGCTAGGTAADADICRISLQTTESTSNPITESDSGDVLIALIAGVSVSATVSESLSFSINSVASGSCTGDTGSPSTVTTTSATVPFGTISTPNAFFAGCQTLTVSTNSTSGYTLSGQENTTLRTSGGTNIADTACDSGCNDASGTSWATATNNGFGYFCENISGTPCSVAGTSNYKQFACVGSGAQCAPESGGETAQNIMSSNSPVSNSQSKVHYKLSISGTQAAGIYSNTVTYITTPSF